MNYLGRGVEADFKPWIEKMYALAHRTVVFNMTSMFVDGHARAPEVVYYDPAEVFNFCRSICRDVVLIHNYLPHDFTIRMHKPDLA